MYFMVFFFVFFFQFLVSVFYALGIGGMGSCGLILGFSKLKSGGYMTFVGVLMVLIGAGFAAAALGDFYMLVRVRLVAVMLNSFAITYFSHHLRFTECIAVQEPQWLKPRQNSLQGRLKV